MGRRLICEHTYAGTLEKDPSFAPGPSVGNASPDLMSCSDTREHTQVCHLQPHKQTNTFTSYHLSIIPHYLSHLSAIYSSVHQSIPVNHSRISPFIHPSIHVSVPSFPLSFLLHIYPSFIPIISPSVNLINFFCPSSHQPTNPVHPFVHQSIPVIHSFTSVCQSPLSVHPSNYQDSYGFCNSEKTID